LHVHLEGTIRAKTLLAIARRNGLGLPADSVEGLRAVYKFTDFKHFIDVWILTTNCLRTADDFRQVVVDYAAEAASHGAVYLEGIFSPVERVARGVSWDDLFNGYTDGADEALERYGVTVRFTPDIYRGGPVDLSEEAARRCVRFRNRGVLGFGIGGYEPGRPIAPYVKAFDIARDGGLALVPHAGEAAGPDSIREALALGPSRIRHGIRSVDDPDLLAEIVDRGIVLDVAPMSNLRTAVVASLEEHPLPRLRASGAMCSISTDDPAMFDTDLATDYAAAESLGVSASDAFAAGLAGMLADDATRTRIAALAP
jgi:aminodeoxyfutalosine deaminase